MFVAGFLFLALILVGESRLVTIRQGIEGLDPSFFYHPFLLPGDRLLFCMRHGGVGLANGFIQLGEEAGVVLPFARTQPTLRGDDKARPVLLSVLHQQAVTPRSLLLAGDQFTQLPPRFIEAQLRKIEQGLERESARHGRDSQQTTSEFIILRSAKQLGQTLPRQVPVSPFVDLLLKKGLQPGIHHDCPVEQRI